MRTRRPVQGLILAALAVFPLYPLQAAPAGTDDLKTVVAAMAKIGRSFSPSFAPDGQTLAFVSSLSGSPQLWTIPVAGGFPMQLTAFDDPTGQADWSPTGEWIAFILLPSGGLNTQIYLIRPDGTGTRRITDGGQDNNFHAGWTDDGTAVRLTSNRRDPAVTDPYLYTVGAGTLRLL